MKSTAQFEQIVEAWKLKGVEFNRFYKWYFKDRTSSALDERIKDRMGKKSISMSKFKQIKI